MRASRTTFALLLVSAAVLAAPTLSPAASDDAWEAMRREVEDTCRPLAEGLLEAPRIVVDPFGSHSYGLALLTGVETGGDGERTVVCVFDKQSRSAEIGGALDLGGGGAAEATGGSGEDGAPATPFEGACAAACAAILERFSQADRRSLAAIGARIDATLRPIRSRDAVPPDVRPAHLAARRLGDALAMADMRQAAPTTVPEGARGCGVFWFGFLDAVAQRVGSHRCRVTRQGDALVVEKLTGDGLRAELLPLDGGLYAFAGRTFLPDQDERRYDPAEPANAGNANFGDKVGLAMMIDGRLALVSIDARGMSPPDETFFDVLLLD